MLIALSVVLALTALLVVAYPILRGRQTTGASTTAQEKLEELMAQREATFQALRDLQFDREAGKISAEDFPVFEASLKRAAADALRNLDTWEATADQALGEKLANYHARQHDGPHGTRTCPHCGRSNAAANQFCTGCGGALSARPASSPQAASPVCPRCGRPLADGDRFCAGCGEQLATAPLRRGEAA